VYDASFCGHVAQRAAQASLSSWDELHNPMICLLAALNMRGSHSHVLLIPGSTF